MLTDRRLKHDKCLFGMSLDSDFAVKVDRVKGKIRCAEQIEYRQKQSNIPSLPLGSFKLVFDELVSCIKVLLLVTSYLCLYLGTIGHEM